MDIAHNIATIPANTVVVGMWVVTSAGVARYVYSVDVRASRDRVRLGFADDMYAYYGDDDLVTVVAK